jgi:WD40 repeat protein
VPFEIVALYIRILDEDPRARITPVLVIKRSNFFPFFFQIYLLLPHFQGHTKAVLSCLYIPGADLGYQFDDDVDELNPSDKFITSSADCTARSWSIETGACLKVNSRPDNLEINLNTLEHPPWDAEKSVFMKIFVPMKNLHLHK